MTTALEKYQAEIKQGLVAQARAAVITTDEDYQEICLVARRVKTRIEAIEEERKKITVPLNEALRNTNALARSVSEQYELAERILKDKISAHLQAAKELEAEVVQQTQTHDQLGVVALAAPVAEGVSERTYYDFVIEDPSQVPDTFWVIDEKALRAYIKATKGKTPVPGVKILTKKDVAISRG